MLTIFDVANWFLTKESITHKKLQKLCYYAYSWFIFFYNDDINNLEYKLFDGEFEAWIHGPVNKNLYNRYKANGYMNIREVNGNTITNENIIEHLEDIWKEYGDYNGDQLESITHKESPWINARNGLEPHVTSNRVLSDKDMFKEYAKRY